MLAIALYAILQICFSANGYLILSPESHRTVYKGLYAHVQGVPGEPLFLTPYIEAGKIREGRDASRVGPIIPSDSSTISYSGFLTVNKKWNSNLFFWFFLSKKNPQRAPILLWLQGGPGASSLYGLFVENGPYQLSKKGDLAGRNYTWTNEYNVLYIDQPVGTGFSFTQSHEGYARTQQDVVRDLYPALIQFFQLFREYSRNDFYISGESYAGKYIPSLADAIRIKNGNASTPIKINLKGLLIGNGYTDPENMMLYGDYLYQLGFVDSKTLAIIHKFENAVRTYIRSKNYVAALHNWQSIFAAARALPRSAIYDYTSTEAALDYRVQKLFEGDRIRKCIHVGYFKYAEINYDVYYHMALDFMQSAAPLIPDLLKRYKILVYTGQLDVIVAYPLVRNYLQNLHFDGAANYYENNLKIWHDELGVHAGHYKTVGNLTDLLVRNSGHMVPTDQPKWAFQMVKKFIAGEFR